MAPTIIQVEQLSKQYPIGPRDQYQALRDVLANRLSAPWRWWRRRAEPGAAHSRAGTRSVWALRDISFEIEPGAIVGIIGPNGAGKSTLLKILSRITRPTTGRARLRGRVGSLLEVGTGFHPELTGRENVYLNGAILGMKRAEISRKFDEIVAFADIEQFLDTPVKRYSSGMHMRLAFAVAAHLEPEILIVDEVLAVGDAAFQKKCLGKMSEVGSDGRTVLFVTHNMAALQRLCPRSLLLDRGRLIAHGDTRTVVSQYLSSVSTDQPPRAWLPTRHVRRRKTTRAYVTAVRYSSDRAACGFRPYPAGPVEVALRIQADRALTLGSVAVIIYDDQGYKLVNADTVSLGQAVRLHPGENVVGFRIEALYLNPGRYRLGWWLSDGLKTVFDFAEGALEIEVVAPAREGTEQFGGPPKSNGVVACNFDLLEGV